MTLKEYEVTINGHPTTLQLDDDDAVLWGVKEPVPQSKTPAGKIPAAKVAAKDGRTSESIS